MTDIYSFYPPPPSQEEIEATQQQEILEHQARHVLADPYFQQQVKILREGYFHEWQVSSDPKARDELWARSRALEDLLIQLAGPIPAEDKF